MGDALTGKSKTSWLLEGLAEVWQWRGWCRHDAGATAVAGRQQQRGVGRRRAMRRLLGHDGRSRRCERGPGRGLSVVRLLGMANQVVLAAKLLRAELALEVALARVHDKVPLHILAREERALATVALEAALGGWLDEPRGAGVHLEVKQHVFAAREGRAAQAAHRVARLSCVQRRVLSERER